MEMVNVKKLISLVLALMICMSVTCTAFAAAYTASVENKGAPAVVEIQDAEGNSAVAALTGDLPEGLALVTGDFLVVTALADAQTSAAIPDTSEQALLEVYNGLEDGSIQVPFEELDPENADNLVIRDLFDVSWTDVDGNSFEELLNEEGVSLQMTFAMDLEAGAKVYVMVYKNDTWNQIEQVTNNGDGTITCVFGHLCPVAVIVEADETMDVVNQSAEQSPETAANVESVETAEASGQNVTPWIVILAVSALVLVGLFVGKKRKQK